VICAYPISPQTHIVEELSRLVQAGTLTGCRYLNVESEFAALSGLIGASAVGARTFTATASQGLLYMAEPLYNAAGMELPIVMTVANRAIGAPINIWNDHSDSLSQRASGWLQLYAADNQEAVDLHVQAFRIAEELSLPVMVCMDGFVLTHATERLDVPSQDEVDAFLPPFAPRQVLDPDEPLTMGAMVGPEAFTEVRYLAHLRALDALRVVPAVAAQFAAAFGRTSGGLLRTYRTDDALTVVVAMGSVAGTMLDVVDALRADGEPVGAVTLTTLRPFPYDALREAVPPTARTVVVVERAIEPGTRGVVAPDVRVALDGTGAAISTAVAGLGGRPVTTAVLRDLLRRATRRELSPFEVLDLRTAVVEREAERVRVADATRAAAAGGGRP
jgi:pyruvate ferredoxin oxidoreductase alpha subunit